MDLIVQQLINYLRANSREPTASLARKLGISRTTVEDRISRLERRKIIEGYTIRFHGDYAQRLISAHVMIQVQPWQTARINASLSNIPTIRTLHAVSGQFDLIAVLQAETTEEIDRSLDIIGNLAGVEKTMSSVVLSTRFER
ncbi:MAG: DNA-binding Lrp family transcriptional regulator [Gammaproteobacteria bacterium]|jgi:DNA-binding Lrp family transcriptional regulator